jgi:transposase
MKSKPHMAHSLKNQLLQLRQEKELSMDTHEKAVLSYVIKSKQHELAAIRRSQRELTTQMHVLLETYGGNLSTIPGIGSVLAAKIVAHSSGASRFANRDKFVRYAVIAPLERSSGKYQRFARGKKGNRSLHATLYMAAHNQIQWNSKAKEYYEKKGAEGKTKKQALVCVMKRTACIIYGMLKSGQEYRN